MTAQEFVDVIKVVVQQSSVRDTINNLKNPPKWADEDLRRLSNFYQSLDEENQILLNQILNIVAETTLFGLLCVIDGVRVIEGAGEKGTLSLIYEKDGQSVLLNDPSEDYLHDLM